VLEQEIEVIRKGIKEGRFVNEAAVSQGIVLRLLHGLGWPLYDTQIIWPEYALRGYRVDFALCHPPGKALALVEVKQVGKSEGSELQLFEYAFHAGVPMAVLTDEQEWNFFLPGGQGNYGERRIYKLDIVERELSECAARLRRYLAYENIVSGAALQAARDDYDNISKDRQMLAALPKAWSQIINDEDEMLLEIVADRVESLCGFKPLPDVIARFLKNTVARGNVLTTVPYRRHTPPAPTASEVVPAQTTSVMPQPQGVKSGTGQIGDTFDGKFHAAHNAADVLKQVLELLPNKDPLFSERFAGMKHGRTRRYLARESSELYPGRPDLCRDYSVRLESGWWLSTNHSRRTIARIIESAVTVARIGKGHNLRADLGE